MFISSISYWRSEGFASHCNCLAAAINSRIELRSPNQSQLNWKERIRLGKYCMKERKEGSRTGRNRVGVDASKQSWKRYVSASNCEAYQTSDGRSTKSAIVEPPRLFWFWCYLQDGDSGIDYALVMWIVGPPWWRISKSWDRGILPATCACALPIPRRHWARAENMTRVSNYETNVKVISSRGISLEEGQLIWCMRVHIKFTWTS